MEKCNKDLYVVYLTRLFFDNLTFITDIIYIQLIGSKIFYISYASRGWHL